MTNSGPQISLAESTSSTKLDRFQSAAYQNDVAATGQHDGAKNNLGRPRGSDVATYPLVCLVLCVPNETHQITDANAAGPLIKTISAR